MESFTGNQRKLEETKEDWKNKKARVLTRSQDFYKENKGGRYHEQYPLEDNNTDLSSYFRVDKKKVLCYTKFTK